MVNYFFKSLAVLVMVWVPRVATADMNFLERILFSDKGYANEIEVKAYIITQEQAYAALCDPPEQPIQLDNKALYAKNTYLCLQVRNMGNKRAWGTLACSVPGYHVPIKVPTFRMDDPDKYKTYLYQLGLIVLTANNPGSPKVSVEWDALYTK